MKIKSWQTECALRRHNRGKKTATELANAEARTQLRHEISNLAAEWQRENTRTTKESTDIMNTEKKHEFRRLVHEELRMNYWGDYGLFEKALANVVKSHPEFTNCKAELLTEFANEKADKPTPRAFRAEVLREVKATGLDYDSAFAVVAERHPAVRNQTAFDNESLALSRQAGVAFQEALDAHFKARPSLDRRKQGDYECAFKAVAKARPELCAKMWKPGRSPSNLWQRTEPSYKTQGKPCKKN